MKILEFNHVRKFCLIFTDSVKFEINPIWILHTFFTLIRKIPCAFLYIFFVTKNFFSQCYLFCFLYFPHTYYTWYFSVTHVLKGKKTHTHIFRRGHTRTRENEGLKFQSPFLKFFFLSSLTSSLYFHLILFMIVSTQLKPH